MKPKSVWFTLGVGFFAAFALPTSSPAAEGDISTIAGGGSGGLGDGGAATSAELNRTLGIALPRINQQKAVELN